ncbi:MAG: polysaccharide biosynthesis protein, partial [Duodenibacillus sp.]|nr:polysaccharide biosynthesis protein [Duodenibacillus sp.]
MKWFNKEARLALKLFKLPRAVKTAVILALDVAAIAVSYYLAFALRFHDLYEDFLDERLWWVFLVILTAGSIGMFKAAGVYRIVTHLMSYDAAWRATCGLFSSFFLLLALCISCNDWIPRSIPFIYLVFLTILTTGWRLWAYAVYATHARKGGSAAVIYGAGDCGSQLAVLLRSGEHFEPVCFVDDAEPKQGMIVQGLRVHAPSELPELIERYGVKKILMAMPRESRQTRRAILEKLQRYRVGTLSVPSLVDVAAGKVAQFALEDVQLADLLGRDPVKPIEELLRRTTAGKAVMVTGGGGSIGSELCRQIASHKPKVLVIFELSEPSLYLIDQELKKADYARGVEIVPCLGSVQDQNLLEHVMKTFAIETVYHAAAYKHVPLM